MSDKSDLDPVIEPIISRRTGSPGAGNRPISAGHAFTICALIVMRYRDLKGSKDGDIVATALTEVAKLIYETEMHLVRMNLL